MSWILDGSGYSDDWVRVRVRATVHDRGLVLGLVIAFEGSVLNFNILVCVYMPTRGPGMSDRCNGAAWWVCLCVCGGGE